MPIAGQTAKSGMRLAIALAALAQLIFLVWVCGLLNGCASDGSNAKLLWKYSAPRRSHWTANGTADEPKVTGDIVIYAGGYPDHNEIFLNAVDFKTGKKIWSSEHSVSKFIISGDSIFYTTLESMTSPQPGKKKKEWIRCADISTGKLIWEQLIETSYGSLQFLSDGSFLYLLVDDAEICAIDKKTGGIAWHHMLRSVSRNAAYTPASVAASGDTIFVAMPNHTISVVDGTTGEFKSVIRRLRLPASEGRRIILPVKDLIVLVDSDGFVSTVNGNTARISTPVATGPLASPPSIDDSSIYLSLSGLNLPEKEKVQHQGKVATPGKERDSSTKQEDAPLAKNKQPPQVASGPVPPPAQKYLCAIAVDNVTPDFKWLTEVNSTVSQPPVLSDKMLLAGTAEPPGEVLAFQKNTGTPIWTYNSGPVVGRPAIDGDTVFATNKDGLMALDASSGKLLWKYRMDNTTPASGPVISGDIVLLVGRDSNLYAVKLEKSKEIKVKEAAARQ